MQSRPAHKPSQSAAAVVEPKQGSGRGDPIGRSGIPAWLFSWKALAAAAIALVLVNCLAYWLTHHSRSSTAVTARGARELAIGPFEFERPNNRDKTIVHGVFSLRLTLSDKLTAEERRQVDRTQSRLAQAVDEALRRMRLSDFAEARLLRVKNKLLSQLNDELGFDAVADLAIEGFQLETLDPAGGGPRE